MKGYRKTTGIYIELADSTPVSPALVNVALRPSSNHVFSDTWQTAPLDPLVCWRVKTAQEVTAEKNVDLQAFLDSPGGKVVKAILQVGVDKGTWTLAEIRAKYQGFA